MQGNGLPSLIGLTPMPGAQYPSMKEYTLESIMGPSTIECTFRNEAVVGSLGELLRQQLRLPANCVQLSSPR